MSRKNSRKVLYEVSNEVKKARSRPKLEIIKRAKAISKRVAAGRAVKLKEKPAIKPIGVKSQIIVIVGKLFNFSVKKAVVVLVIVAAIVILWPSGKGKEQPVSGNETSASSETSDLTENTVSDEETIIAPAGGIEHGSQVVVAGPPRDHCIVIAQHKDIEQLKPVAKHFSANGFESKFRQSGNWHLLITKDRYISTKFNDTEAFKAQKQIIKIGDEYKPPRGYGSFNFDTVLIMKISGE